MEEVVDAAEQSRVVDWQTLPLQSIHFDNVPTDRTLVIPVCKTDSTGRTDRFYLLRCQCGTTGTEPRVHISIKSSYVVSDAEHCERTRYIERYLQPFIMHLYVHVWNLNRPVFFVSGVLLCEAPQRELYDCGAHVMALAAEIVFEMPSFDRRPWEME
jgi:hypothetical protein